MAARVQLREIISEEGNPRHRRGSARWFHPDTVQDVIHNFTTDGFDALYQRYLVGWPQTFTLPKR